MITGTIKKFVLTVYGIFLLQEVWLIPLMLLSKLLFDVYKELDDNDNKQAKESIMLDIPYKSKFSGQIEINGRTIPGESLKWSVLSSKATEDTPSSSAN